MNKGKRLKKKENQRGAKRKSQKKTLQNKYKEYSTWCPTRHVGTVLDATIATSVITAKVRFLSLGF